MWLSQSKNGGAQPKCLKCFWSIWYHNAFFSYIFFGNRCTRFIESNHQRVSFLEVKKLFKKLEKISFLVFFLNQKQRSATKKFETNLIKFGFTILCSATYFQEVGAHVSLKVATKRSLRTKKIWKFKFLGGFSKAKMEHCC